jgi:hypothetical protein
MSLFENEFEAEFPNTVPEPEEAPELPYPDYDFIIDEGEPIKARNTGEL